MIKGKTQFIANFKTIELVNSKCNWYIVKEMSVIVLCENDIALITIYHFKFSKVVKFNMIVTMLNSVR